jgi:hypothetical protein
MDILLTAILGALVNLTDTAVRDAYDGLKSLIKCRFGDNGALAGAVEEVEKKPDSEARKAVLKEEISAIQGDRDEELIGAAKALIAAIQALPGGQESIQDIRVTQTIHGDRNLVSGTGDIHIKTGSGRD